MRASHNILRFVLGAVFVLVISLCVAVYLSANVYDKNSAETLASEALGVPVSMDGFELSLAEKTVVITNLKIYNPDGYDHPYALLIGQVDIELVQIEDQLVRLGTVQAKNVVVNLEVRRDATNLTDIRKGISHQGILDGGIAKAMLDEQYDQSVMVFVDRLDVPKGQLMPSVLLGRSENVQPVLLPDMGINIGSEGHALMPEQAVSVIYEMLTRVAIQRAYSAGFLDGMRGVTDVDLAKKIKAGKEFADRFIDNLGPASEKVQKDLEDFTEGVSKLLFPPEETPLPEFDEAEQDVQPEAEAIQP